jgi:hypothetical protein
MLTTVFRSRAATIALAEFDAAFNGDEPETAPRGGMGGNRFGGYPPRGPRSTGPGAGFVRAGGEHDRKMPVCNPLITSLRTRSRYDHGCIPATAANSHWTEARRVVDFQASFP